MRLLLVVALAACGADRAEPPRPRALTSEPVKRAPPGHFDHNPGPGVLASQVAEATTTTP